MSTEAQITANRANAQKSTGPKTQDGKDKVAKNALKHGLLARRFFIGPDQQQEFADFRDALRADLAPDGLMQTILADRIADLAWRLQQCKSIYDNVLNIMIQVKMRRPGMYHRPESFDTLQEVEDCLLGSAAVADFGHDHILDRLFTYEQRIERSLFNAHKEYRTLRAFRAREEDEVKECRADLDSFFQQPMNATAPRPKRRDRRSEQTNPTVVKQYIVNPTRQSDNDWNKEIDEDKTNPNSTPSDPARPAFSPNTDPNTTPPTPNHSPNRL